MKKALTLLAILSLALVLLWRPWEKKTVPAAIRPIDLPTPSTPLPGATNIIPETPLDPASPDTPPAIPHEEIQRVLDAIDNLEFSFRDHAVALGGNPIGTNAEITAALLGDNAKQLRLAIPQGSTVNSQGELCDPWGSPWFFHQISGTKMEIRSAGSDRNLYTADDFVR